MTNGGLWGETGRPIPLPDQLLEVPVSVPVTESVFVAPGLFTFLTLPSDVLAFNLKSPRDLYAADVLSWACSGQVDLLINCAFPEGTMRLEHTDMSWWSERAAKLPA